jgi:tetratricopeptide (TPR) repeat protein/tRNA A-37 threonylcarbamoyl transferase component Bud32
MGKQLTMNSSPQKFCVVCHREFSGDFQECPDDMVRLTEKDSTVGTIFDGKYEILDFIGAGGLSRVYKARHRGLNRTLALKVLKSSELIDLQRFRREAISIAQLEHPNIARVFSFAVAPNGCPYMALEFLDGRDLAEWLAREGPLNLKQALILFEQVASALEHAHSRNIIHRDIKPGNIVLLSNPDHADCVKVVDFGMARVQLEGGILSQRITQEGEIFGTRQYISPEQYRGVVADGRADIYSLGVSMYESVLKDGKIPEMLRPVISKATETDPTARFQTATELKEELVRLRELLSSSLEGSRTGYVALDSKKSENYRLGTFYFWSMLTGMIVVAVCAMIVVKQRIALLESVSTHPHKSALGRLAAMSLAATQNQAEALVAMGQTKEAIKLFEDWLQRNRHSEKWSAQCVAEKQLAALYSSLDNMDLAEKCAAQGLSIADKHGIKSGYEYVDLLSAMAAIKFARKDYSGSMALSTKVLELTQEMEFNHELDANLLSLYNIARCQRELAQLNEAEQTANEGLELSEKSYGEYSSEAGECCEILAGICDDRKQYSQALTYMEKSRACYRKSGARHAEEFLLATARKAVLETKMKDDLGAVRDYDFVFEQLLKSKNVHPSFLRQIKEQMSNLASLLGKTADLDKWKN